MVVSMLALQPYELCAIATLLASMLALQPCELCAIATLLVSMLALQPYELCAIAILLVSMPHLLRQLLVRLELAAPELGPQLLHLLHARGHYVPGPGAGPRGQNVRWGRGGLGCKLGEARQGTERKRVKGCRLRTAAGAGVLCPKPYKL